MSNQQASLEKRQQYTGDDRLVAALEQGWTLGPVVFREERYVGNSSHHILIYHVTLLREGESMKMSVLSTPVVARLIAQHGPQAVAAG